MKEVMRVAEEIVEEIKNFIIAFLTTFLFIIPFAGSAIGMAAGMANIGRIIMLIGEVGLAALDIYETVQTLTTLPSPSSACFLELVRWLTWRKLEGPPLQDEQ